MKAALTEQIFLEIKVYLARDIEGLVLLCDIPKIINLFF